MIDLLIHQEAEVGVDRGALPLVPEIGAMILMVLDIPTTVGIAIILRERPIREVVKADTTNTITPLVTLIPIGKRKITIPHPDAPGAV